MSRLRPRGVVRKSACNGVDVYITGLITDQDIAYFVKRFGGDPNDRVFLESASKAMFEREARS